MSNDPFNPKGDIIGDGSAAGTVALVHGGFVDGLVWQGVYDQLKKDGYNVSVVQNPTLSLEDDVAVAELIEKAARWWHCRCTPKPDTNGPPPLSVGAGRLSNTCP